MPDNAPPVSLTIDDGIACLTLDRPETVNAIDSAFAASFKTQSRAIAEDGSARVVVLSANGRTFCVGGDLGFMSDAGDDVRDALFALATDLHAGIQALAELDAPVIASVNGVAAGAGMSLVCGADLVVASTHAKFTMAYTNAGLSPDGGSTWYLPRLVGPRRAAELMITNSRLTAEEAHEAGIVNRVVAPDALAETTHRLATEIAAGPTLAFGAVKRLLRSSTTAEFFGQLDAEAESISTLAAGRDGREGVEAFLAKRPPVFTGRN